MAHITDRDRLLSSPLALKEEGSPAWCWQVLEGLRWAYTRLDSDWAYVEELRGRLAAHRAWEKVPPDAPTPFGDEDTMLREVVGVDSATLNARVISAQERAENAKPALTHEEAGTLGGRGNRKAPNHVSSFTHGNNADYLTARIARDHPDILARMRAGEFPSVRQAGIAAGIVKRATPLDTLLKTWGKATEEERAAFLRTIAAQLATGLAEGEGPT